MAQDGFKRASEPKVASKIAQDSTTWLSIANSMPPRGPKKATRRIQALFGTPQDSPEKPKSFNNLKDINGDYLHAFSLPMRFCGLKMAPKKA